MTATSRASRAVLNRDANLNLREGRHHLEFGRIVASEIEVPNMLAILA
jgi:hypothetical protein